MMPKILCFFLLFQIDFAIGPDDPILVEVQKYLAENNEEISKSKPEKIAEILDKSFLRSYKKEQKLRILSKWLRTANVWLDHRYIFYWLLRIDDKAAREIADKCISGDFGEYCVERVVCEDDLIVEKHVPILEKLLFAQSATTRTFSIVHLRNLYKKRKNGDHVLFADRLIASRGTILYNGQKFIADPSLLMTYSSTIVFYGKTARAEDYLFLIRNSDDRATQANCLFGILKLIEAKRIENKKALRDELDSLNKKAAINKKNMELFEQLMDALAS